MADQRLEHVTVKAVLMDEGDLNRTLDRMACQIVELVDPESSTDRSGGSYGLIGMQTRGVYLARRLQGRIRQTERIEIPVGVLDATMYRDDFGIRGRHPIVKVTDVPFDVSGRDIILIDDVLHTGRTIRAALDALVDMGRPASVHCLVMVDRGAHELPICADIIGRVVPTLPGEEVRVKLREIDDVDEVQLVENVEQIA